MTTISLRMDDQMKKELDEMCEAMGMNISTFYMIYTKKALRDRRIPFDIEAPADPFYSEQNMAQLRKSAQQVKEGKIIRSASAGILAAGATGGQKSKRRCNQHG